MYLDYSVTHVPGLYLMANQGLVPTWRAASMKVLRLRAWRASIIVLRSASATRHNPSR